MDVESAHLSDFTAAAGLYFSCPLSPHFALGTKLLAGRSYMRGIDIKGTVRGVKMNVDMAYENEGGHRMLTYDITPSQRQDGTVMTDRYEATWDYFKMDGSNSLCLSTGLSATYAYKSFFTWRVFVDYDFTKKTYDLTYDPMQFVRSAANRLTFNGREVSPDDYIRPYTARQRKSMNIFSLGAAFSISF